VGLEAGSRAELLAVIALSRGGVIVCNGYKDKAYIRLALMAVRMGLNVFLVVEKLSELSLILQQAKQLEVEPQIGVRIRLSNVADNRWQNSGGEKSKFGLSAAHVLSVVEQLSQHNCLHWLTMMHVHIGSQVTRLDSFEKGLLEAGRFYTELHRLGAQITTFDVGGGLAVDYEGSGTTGFCSMDYSIEDYAQTIVHNVKQVCDQNNLPEPDIFTESGRAMTAHHSVLITRVVDVETVVATETVDQQPLGSPQALIQQSEQIQDKLQKIRSDYIAGQLELSQLANSESSCYQQLEHIRYQLNIIQSSASANAFVDEALNHLNEKLADKVFCNFSLFQSMPDAWAFQQRFPIMPLFRLNEQPLRRAVIEDLTCDSDGSVAHYVEQQGIQNTMPLHDITDGDDYYLGFFLLGAYQEILGDMHNLFGDTDAINIHLDQQGCSHYYSPSKGDTVADLLEYVHIQPELVLEQLQLKLDNANLNIELKKEFEAMFTTSLQQGSYLRQSE
jgi:arginine decarboxylase